MATVKAKPKSPDTIGVSGHLRYQVKNKGMGQWQHWLEVGALIKVNDPSPFPVLTHIEVFWKNAK